MCRCLQSLWESKPIKGLRCLVAGLLSIGLLISLGLTYGEPKQVNYTMTPPSQCNILWTNAQNLQAKNPNTMLQYNFDTETGIAMLKICTDLSREEVDQNLVTANANWYDPLELVSGCNVSDPAEYNTMLSVCSTVDSSDTCTEIFQITPLPYGFLWEYAVGGQDNPTNCGDSPFTLRYYGSNNPVCTGSLVATYKYVPSNIVSQLIEGAFYCHCAVTFLEIVGIFLWAKQKDWEDKRGQAMAMEGIGGLYAIGLFFRNGEFPEHPEHVLPGFLLVTLTDALTGVVAPFASMYLCSLSQLFVGHISYSLILHYVLIFKAVKLIGVIIRFVYGRCTSKKYKSLN